MLLLFIKKETDSDLCLAPVINTKMRKVSSQEREVGYQLLFYLALQLHHRFLPVFFVISDSPRSVNISADKTGVRVGTNVSLTCASDANPPASSFQWYNLKGGALICLNQNAETITVSIPDPEDGIFHCTAINNLGRANSTAAFVVAAECKLCLYGFLLIFI